MMLARLAVFAAVVCSLFFNGSYAFAKAHTPTQQLAMVAVALSIDLCKCAFLPAASALWIEGRRLAPTVLVLLWPLAFGYSLFAGYASVATNRSDASTLTETQAQARTRAQAAYDDISANLAVAKQAAAWTATAACAVVKTNTHRRFCDDVDRLVDQQRTAAHVLDTTRVVKPDPEVALLASLTDLPRPTLSVAIAFAPALILELVSSLGLYATRRRRNLQAPRTRSGWFFRRKHNGHRVQPKTAPEARPEPTKPPPRKQPEPQLVDDVFEWDLPANTM